MRAKGEGGGTPRIREKINRLLSLRFNKDFVH